MPAAAGTPSPGRAGENDGAPVRLATAETTSRYLGRRRRKEGGRRVIRRGGAAAGRPRRGRGPQRGKEGAPARGGGGRACVCEGEGEITAPPRRAVPSREPRELGRAGEGEPDRRLLPGEPGEGSGTGTVWERPLGCPRPAGGARGAPGRARRAPGPPAASLEDSPSPSLAVPSPWGGGKTEPELVPQRGGFVRADVWGCF